VQSFKLLKGQIAEARYEVSDYAMATARNPQDLIASFYRMFAEHVDRQGFVMNGETIAESQRNLDSMTTTLSLRAYVRKKK
jgi:hypothetical protein